MPFTKQPLTLIKNKVTVEISCNLICCFKMKDTWTQLPVVNSPYSPHFFIFILKEIKVCISGMLYPSLNALVGFYFFFFFFFSTFVHGEQKVQILLFFAYVLARLPNRKHPQVRPVLHSSVPWGVPVSCVFHFKFCLLECYFLSFGFH